MPRSVRFSRHCGWNLIDADPIKQSPLIDSSCTTNYVNGIHEVLAKMERPILFRFQDMLEFRGDYSYLGIRDITITLSFFWRWNEAEMALMLSETNLLHSGIMMVDSNIEVTTMHIHAHKRAN